MAAQPPSPQTVENLGSRTFSFFPAILNIEHNEWTFKESTWSEVLVANVKNGQEIWVPKRFVGDVAKVEEPMAIVGLTKELEYTAGGVVPHFKRVIQMPRAVNEGPRPASGPGPQAPTPLQAISGISGGGADSKIGKVLLIAVAVAIGLVVVAVAFFQDKDNKRVRFAPVVQSEITFGARDDYFAVERRLGKPAEDRWKSDQGEIQFRYLWYPKESIYVILMGADRDKAQYIGELDRDGRVVHSVDANMQQILKRLKKP